MQFDPNTSVLAGLSTDALNAMLTAAQTALGNLMAGSMAETITVTGGGTHREVMFQRTDQANLIMWIKLLQAQLGIIRKPRRAFGVSFG